MFLVKSLAIVSRYGCTKLPTDDSGLHSMNQLLYMFYLSKIVDLFDTFLIVTEKRHVRWLNSFVL